MNLVNDIDIMLNSLFTVSSSILSWRWLVVCNL